MKAAFGLLLLGVGLILYSLSLSPYTDEQVFLERYMSLSSGQSKEYWQLRNEMLTSKYRIQDYGGTACLAGVVLLLLTRTRFHNPKERWPLVAMVLSAPAVSVGAFVFDIFQGARRGEFPPWADSIGIPLMGVPVQLAVLLVWALAHLVFLKAPFATSRPLSFAFSRQANPWLLLVSAATTALIILLAVDGAYWYALAGALWLYIYLALAAGRRADMEPDEPPLL